jgi:hypothetical protein
MNAEFGGQLRGRDPRILRSFPTPFAASAAPVLGIGCVSICMPLSVVCLTDNRMSYRGAVVGSEWIRMDQKYFWTFDLKAFWRTS